MKTKVLAIVALVLGFLLSLAWRFVPSDVDGVKAETPELSWPVDQAMSDPARELREFGRGVSQHEASGVLGVPRGVAGDSSDGTPLELLDYDMLAQLYTAPSSIKDGDVGRIRDLNPRGIRISAECSGALEAARGHLVYPIQRMFNLLGVIRDRELTHLAASGRLRLLRVRDCDAVRRARDANAERGLGAPGLHGARFYENADGMFFFVHHAGSYYGAKPDDLAEHAMCFDYYANTCADAFERLCSAVHGIGMLTDEELGDRVQRAHEWRRRHVGNARERW